MSSLSFRSGPTSLSLFGCRHIVVRLEPNPNIFLACVDYWEASSGAKTLTDAFRILDKRIAERGGGKKVVVKVMYDRGSAKQVSPPALGAPPRWGF